MTMLLRSTTLDAAVREARGLLPWGVIALDGYREGRKVFAAEVRRDGGLTIRRVGRPATFVAMAAE